MWARSRFSVANQDFVGLVPMSPRRQKPLTENGLYRCNRRTDTVRVVPGSRKWTCQMLRDRIFVVWGQGHTRSGSGGTMKRSRHTSLWALAAWLLGASALFESTLVQAADPQLQQAIARGKDHFLHSTFAGRGRVCETCHLGGGMRQGQLPDGRPIPSLLNAAAIFPRISEDDQKLITLADQIRTCIGGALNGNAPAYGSDELNSLVAYVTSLSQGKPIDMGADPK